MLFSSLGRIASNRPSQQWWRFDQRISSISVIVCSIVLSVWITDAAPASVRTTIRATPAPYEGSTDKIENQLRIAQLDVVKTPEKNNSAKAMGEEKHTNEVITLGAGCFWCTEAVFQQIPGVLSVKPGYMGGQTKNPTYEQVCTGTTGHAEVAQIIFNPQVVSLEKILATFWHAHDPTSLNRQGADHGTQYRSAIFYSGPAQRAVAEKSKAAAAKEFTRPIVTEITPAGEFYIAEDYHQNYYRLNKDRNPYCRAVIAPKLEKLGLEK